MRYVTNGIAVAMASLLLGHPASAGMREEVLRQLARDAGLRRPSELLPPIDKGKSEIGRRLFESKLLSFNSDMACKTCHLGRFSSTDGLPNAVGVGGSGEGAEGLASGGEMVPRNVLPLWGRGELGFDTFFWDGKVALADGHIVSQFGD